MLLIGVLLLLYGLGLHELNALSKVLRGLEPEHHHHATSSHLYEAGKSQDYEGIQATYLSQKQKRDLPMCGWNPIRSQDNINSKSSRDIAYRQAPVLAQRPPAGFNSPSLGIFAWQRLYHHFFTPLSRCFVYLKPPSTVAARLSLCVTFFFQHRKKTTGRVFFRLCGFL